MIYPGTTKDFTALLIQGESTLKIALRQLDETGERILFVVGQDDKLIGSLSDGDVRRWILSGGSLEAQVDSACYKKTYYVKQDFVLEDVKNEVIKKNINYVPVVDGRMRIVELIKWGLLSEGKVIRPDRKKIKFPVVIMAGGKGTRLDPFTKILPKPLIPIGDQTIIEIIIGKFFDFGIDDFIISVNFKSKIIKSFFEELAPPYRVSYLHEEEPRGTAGSLKQLQGRLAGSFVMTNCDIIVDTDYAELLEYHNQKKNVITAVASIRQYRLPYGICEIGPDGTLSRLTEKPEYNYLVNAGMYVINSEALGLIPDQGIYHITQLIEDVKKKGGRVGVFPVSENSWIDVGEWDEYLKTIEKIKK